MEEIEVIQRLTELAPEAGLEPATFRLTAGRSTIELLWIPNPKRLPAGSSRPVKALSLLCSGYQSGAQSTNWHRPRQTDFMQRPNWPAPIHEGGDHRGGASSPCSPCRCPSFGVHAPPKPPQPGPNPKSEEAERRLVPMGGRPASAVPGFGSSDFGLSDFTSAASRKLSSKAALNATPPCAPKATHKPVTCDPLAFQYGILDLRYRIRAGSGRK